MAEREAPGAGQRPLPDMGPERAVGVRGPGPPEAGLLAAEKDGWTGNSRLTAALKIRIIISAVQECVILAAEISGCSAVGSALGSGPRGRGFKSRHSDQYRR